MEMNKEHWSKQISKNQGVWVWLCGWRSGGGAAVALPWGNGGGSVDGGHW